MFPIMLQTLKGGPKGNEANTCTHYQKQNKPQGSWLQFKSSTWSPTFIFQNVYLLGIEQTVVYLPQQQCSRVQNYL